MRSFHYAALGTVLLGTALYACNDGYPTENVIRSAEPIQGGTVDQTDTAVVAILINSPQGLALCSGSLIGPNLVLSAHHCVATPPSNLDCSATAFAATYAPASFVVTTSYDAAANAANAGTFPTADNVTWFAVESVSVPGDNICGQDMSALQLSTSIAGVCPIIPRVDADVSDGEAYTAVGFGITSPNGMTAGTRYSVTGMAVICAENCNNPAMSTTEEWEGGASTAKGTCEGDSGGPALDSVGRVMGSVSRGPANACNTTVYESVFGEATWIKQVAQAAAQAGGYAAAGWVTGASTSSATNGYCGSTGTSSSSSSSSSTSSSGGTGGGCPAPLSCIDGSGQGMYGCFDTSTSNGFPPNAPTCSMTEACATGSTCWVTSATATMGDCIEDCTPGSTGSSTSSSSGSSTASSTSSGSGSTGTSGSSSSTTGNGGGNSAGATTGSSGDEGAGGSTATGGPGRPAGCSCSSPASSPSSSGWLALAALGLVLGRRRNRSR